MEPCTTHTYALKSVRWHNYTDNIMLLHNPALGIARPTTLKPLTEKQKDFLYEYYDKRNKPELIREYCM
mgnify:CR=1 FL=1